MRLVLQLVGRLLVVVILCLGAATVWATIDAHRSVDRATAASAERVSRRAGSAVLARIAVAQQQNARAAAAGAAMAHH